MYLLKRKRKKIGGGGGGFDDQLSVGGRQALNMDWDVTTSVGVILCVTIPLTGTRHKGDTILVRGRDTMNLF